MKKLGHEEIGGRWFSVYRVESREELQNMLDSAICHGGRKLDDVYGKYSNAKKRIFEDWDSWANDIDSICYLGIASRNGFVFTLSFVYMSPLFGNCAYAVGRISKGGNSLYVW